MTRVVDNTNLNKKSSMEEKKSYKWEPTDIFDLSGQAFAVLYHMLIAEVTTPLGATIQQKMDAYNVVQELFKRGLDQGAIVEVDSMPPIDAGQIKTMFNKKQ